MVNCNVTLATTFTAGFPVTDTKRISRQPKEFPADETAKTCLGLWLQPGASLRACEAKSITPRPHSLGFGVRLREEDQERREALGDTTMWRILWVSEFRWRRNASQHTLQVGRVTCHPRSCLKNASSPACPTWFHSSACGNIWAHSSRKHFSWSSAWRLQGRKSSAWNLPWTVTPAVPQDIDTPQPGSGFWLGIKLIISSSAWYISSQTPQRHSRHISNTSASQGFPHSLGRLNA